jgi:hypothetical protein
LNVSFGDEFNDISCKFEDLPEDLSSVAYLGLNNEFHFHNTFYANFSQVSQYTRFNLSTESAFRVYVAPHDVDVDLWLRNAQTGALVARSSLDVRTEEIIFKILPAGSYVLEYAYFGVFVGMPQLSCCDSIFDRDFCFYAARNLSHENCRPL